MLTGYRVKKRTFVVAAISLVVSIAVAGMLALYASSILGPGVLHRFSLNEQQGQINLQGGGISLSRADATNLIADGSFEPLYFRHFLNVYGGDSDSLTVSSQEASAAGLYPDDFFIGAQVRVMSLTREGLKLKKTAKATGFTLNQPGIFQPIRLPADLPADFRLHVIARASEESIIAAGDKGTILTIANNQVTSLAYVDSDSKFASIAANEHYAAAVNADGEIYFADDGYTWSKLYDSASLFRAIAVNDDSRIVAVGSDGLIISGKPDDLQPAYSPTKNSINCVATLADGWLAAGNEGTILYSKGGVIWRPLSKFSDSEAQNTSIDINWQAIDVSEKRIMLSGSNGSSAWIDISDTSISPDNWIINYNYASEANSFIDVLTIDEQYITLDNRGLFHISHDNGSNWQQADLDTGILPKSVIYSGDGIITGIDSEGKLAYSQLVAGITLDSPLQEGQYQTGDILYLSKMINDNQISAPATGNVTADAGPVFWESNEHTILDRIVDEGAPAGSGYLSLSSDDDSKSGLSGDLIIYQEINSDNLAKQLRDNVLRFTGWFQAENTNMVLSVSLQGLTKEVSVSFELTADKWRKYSHAFVIPEAWLLDIPDNQTARFVISIEGQGRVLADNIQLLSAADGAQAYTDEYHDLINRIEPSVIRLQFNKVGDMSVVTESWAKSQEQAGFGYTKQGWLKSDAYDLASALDLVYQVDAVPWIVIDSAATEEEIANLTEYLAAPVSEHYGKLRMEQGRAVPWTEAFARIYIEINDDNSLFSDDRLRSAYVNWIIEQVEASPYYLQIKNRLVFVDAMTYNQGLMLSSADFHASDINIESAPDNVFELEQTYAGYWSEIPRNPDKPVQDWPEMLRKISFDDVPDPERKLSSLVAASLYDLSDQTGLALIDLSDGAVNFNARQFGTDSYIGLRAAAEIVSKAVVGNACKVTRLSDSDEIFAFGSTDNGSVRAVICNSSSMPAACQLVSELPLAGAVLHKYDSTGKLIGTEKLRRNDGHITVLPGGVVYLERLDSR